MPDATDTASFDFDDTQRMWELLEQHVEAFVSAWEAGGEPPALEEFAPEHPPATRRLALVELIKVDLDYRYSRGREPCRVEQYLERFPALAAGGQIACDLLYEEYHVRKRHGEDVEPEEYFERFPEQEDELRRLLGIESPQATTALFPTGKRPDELQAGESLDDFDLLAHLGRGAFASVFLARQRSLQRLVALKVSANRGNEPQTLAQLDHPHIVRVFDQRLAAERDLRLLYMQYVPGGTLAEVADEVRRTTPSERRGEHLLRVVDRALEARGEEPPHESSARARLRTASWPEAVCRIGLQLAGALQYAHSRGVLHRDLKPANILLSSEASPRLVDFNISFCSKLDGATPAAYFGGSLAYMSPEQLEACNPAHERTADSLDGRSDLYSLGVVLWELITGVRPFRDGQLAEGWLATLAAVYQRRLKGPDPAAVERLQRCCPEALRDVLLKLLSPNPEDRYRDAADAARAFRLCMQPEAQRLLRPKAKSWRSLVRRKAMIPIVLAMLIPNIFASIFNIHYNYWEIVEPKNADRVFWGLVLWVNTIAFPMGIAIWCYLIYPVWKSMRIPDLTAPDVSNRLPALRHRALRLGHYAAIVAVSEWVAAGFIFPVVMHLAGTPLTALDYIHFIASLALCGLIAASYPFFLATYMTACILYPRLLDAPLGEEEVGSELGNLRWLHQTASNYLVVAFSLPMLGVVLLVVLGGARNRFAMTLLSIGGLIGAVAIFWIARRLQRDVAALADSIALAGDAGDVGTDSFHSHFR